MKRVQKNLLAALVLLGVGGGAAIYTLETRVKSADQRFQEEQDRKRLFHFGRAHVRSGRLEAETATFAFSRRSERWQITEPVSWPGDAETISALLDRMAAIKADTVVTEEATQEDLRRAGLLEPHITLSVELEDGETRTLFVGDKNELTNSYPITNADKKRVGLSEPSFYWAFDRPLAEFRDDRVFPFDDARVAEVKVRDEGGALRIHLQEGDDGAWQVSGAGLEEPVKADTNTVRIFLVSLTKRLEAERYITDEYAGGDAETYGLHRPEAVIEVTPAGGEPRIARLGRWNETSAEEGTPVVHVEGTTTLVEVDPRIFAALARPAAGYRDRRVARFDPDDAARVRITLGAAKTIELERSDGGGDWTIVSEPEPRPARVWKVDALLKLLSRLRVEQWRTLEATRDQLSEWLLDPASRRVEILGAKDEVLADVRIGNFATEETLFVTAGDSKRVGVMDAEKVRVFPEDVEDLVDTERE